MSILSILGGPVKALVGEVGGIIDNLHTSGEEKAAAKQKLAELAAATELSLEQLANEQMALQRDVIVAEAQGESWIQRSWRPVAMLTMLALVVWQVVFASVFNLEPDWQAVPDRAWGLLSLGIGGYIAGRSTEKVFKTKADAAVRIKELEQP